MQLWLKSKRICSLNRLYCHYLLRFTCRCMGKKAKWRPRTKRAGEKVRARTQYYTGAQETKQQAITSEANVEADGNQNTEQGLGRLEQQTLVSSTVKSLAYNHDGVPTNVDSTGGPAEDGTGGWSAESGSSGATGSSGP